MPDKVYSVVELTREVKRVLENSIPRIWVEGEISNFKRHTSGHFYFTLKDEKSQVSCAMWRFKAGDLLFRPQDGMKVLVQGEVQVYERGGYYQLIIQQMQPAGVGALQIAFEQLKKKLFQEGLFAEERKRPIPLYPQMVGVVTSPTGAAIRDIVSVVCRRFPCVQVILAPVRVQGPGAAEEVAAAIGILNEFADVEVIIVGRGGGSLEDLWAFNEEIVARAIFNSSVPVISAVGHEVDYSISDFVADKRAPTPSVAGEMVVRDRQELAGILAYYREKMDSCLLQFIEGRREKLQVLRNSYAFRRPEDIIYQKIQRLDELSRSLDRGIQRQIDGKQQLLNSLGRHLNALNPENVLNRGYSLCYKNGKIVKNSRQIAPLDVVQVRLARGQFISQVQLVGESHEKRSDL
ncbi:MAG: exodeoxyribonuclease VII large subunit [Calditrichia bacterium]